MIASISTCCAQILIWLAVLHFPPCGIARSAEQFIVAAPPHSSHARVVGQSYPHTRNRFAAHFQVGPGGATIHTKR